MFNGYRILLLLCFSFLTACHSFNTDGNKDDKPTRAAKINVKLAMAYLERHDNPRAKQKLLLALEQAPSIPETWYAMGYFLEATGDNEEASKHYLKALRIAPRRGDVLNNYGTYLCRNGNYRKAIHYFLQAVKDPAYLGISSAYENAGLCAQKIPDNHAAIQFFDKAVAHDTTVKGPYYHLAELYYQQGNYLAARKELNHYLQNAEPSHESFLLGQKIDMKLDG